MRPLGLCARTREAARRSRASNHQSTCARCASRWETAIARRAAGPRHSRIAAMAAAAAVFAVSMLPERAHAQVYERVAPKVLPDNVPAPIREPAPTVPPAASGEVLLPVLNGLVFVPDRTAIRTASPLADSLGPSRITTAGLPLLSDPRFIEQVKPFIGARL